MEHVGIVVDDLAAATAFFGEGPVEVSPPVGPGRRPPHAGEHPVV
jgi:catechol 2,3-dioxygenase-like lactoylglutathione lyase family enzyme